MAEQDPDGVFVGVRWVDRNKGSEGTQDIRSRLVAQEFATKDREGLFAATPPLGAARAMLSLAASQGVRRPGHYHVMLLDVKKVFLYGAIQRKVYIELPSEDPERKGGQMVGMLHKAMYGLRDAPQVWQEEVRRLLGELGFVESVTAPCVYYNSVTGVRLVTHVDDFLCIGPRRELKQFHTELANTLELKCELLGPGQGESRKGSFLGRTIEWHDWGIAWRGDQGILRDMLVEWDMERCSPVSTPYSKDEGNRAGEEGDIELRDQSRVTKFRRAAAQLNYMALDDPRISDASKQI